MKAMRSIESPLPSALFTQDAAVTRDVAEIKPMFRGTYLLTMKDQQRTEIHVSELQSRRVREMLQV